MRELVRRARLERHIDIDSAGTAAYHSGEPPDARASAAARRRGIQLAGRARRFEAEDWQRFDYILVMDRSNLDDLSRVAPAPQLLKKVRLLRSFDPKAPRGAAVPDPYYGGDSGFDDVIDLCQAACEALLEHLREEHGF